MSLVTHHISFTHGTIQMASRARGLGQAPPLRQSKNRSDSQGETSSLEEAAILDRIKWNSKPPFPPNQGCSRAKAKTTHFPILDLGGGEGYKFPIYFVQDCSLCNALIEHKTRIALIAFSRKNLQATRRRAMDEKKYCNVNRIKAISKLSASLTNRLW